VVDLALDQKEIEPTAHTLDRVSTYEPGVAWCVLGEAALGATDARGPVIVPVGTQDLGMGHETLFSPIAGALAAGVPFDCVRLRGHRPMACAARLEASSAPGPRSRGVTEIVTHAAQHPQRAATYRSADLWSTRPQVVEEAGHTGDSSRDLKILVSAVQSRPSPPIFRPLADPLDTPRTAAACDRGF
jgi:hypothetical protein